MKSLFLPVLAVLAAAAPAASPPASIDLLKEGAKDISAAIKTPLTVEIDPETSALQLSGERVLIAPETAALVKSREEAKALVALAVAYKPEQFNVGRRKPGTAEYAAALLPYLAAQGAFDRQQRSNGSGYPAEWSQPSGGDPTEVRAHIKAAKQGRAAYAVHLLQRSGGCSGPMVDLLNRMRAEDHTSATASDMTNAGFARVVLADLGSTVYPPDRSCE